MIPHDPDHISLCIHTIIGGLEYQLKRHSGYLDRLQSAIAGGRAVAAESLPARYLANDARSLRELADKIDQCRVSLFGNLTASLPIHSEN